MLADGRWREEIVLPADGSGAEEGLPLSVLCGSVFDVAGVHASQLDLGLEDLHARNLTWMLARFRMSLAARPQPAARVRVTTWPSGVSRLFALREFRVTSAAGTELAAATSAWLLVDRKSRRPLRPDPHVAHLEVPDRALAVALEKLEGPGNPAWSFGVAVRAEHIDLNGHVGSLWYIRWIEEALAAVGGPVALTDLEINYNAEVFQGDTLRVVGEAGPRDDGRRAVALLREADGVPVATAAVAGVGVRPCKSAGREMRSCKT